jgi:hypothetical protein
MRSDVKALNVGDVFKIMKSNGLMACATNTYGTHMVIKQVRGLKYAAPIACNGFVMQDKSWIVNRNIDSNEQIQII